MAITEIHPITITPELALNYTKKDKFVGETVHETISVATNCSVQNANVEMQNVRQSYGKDSKNLLYHVVQNFGKKIDPRIANEIGCKLARELFSKYQCVISTHTNTEYTHNHIMFNSVSFVNGEKYNDCLKTYAEIRKASDRLCQEYGLEILIKTKDFKLKKYKDVNGKIKHYEPTERKNKIREGKFANANDYRDTHAFKQKEIFKKSNIEVIREDINKLLPYCTSYENLLTQLRDIGYTIKSRTKSGGWLKHISFQAPGQLKATRDSSLGEEFIREILANIIEQSQQTQVNVEPLQDTQTPQINDKEIYILGRIDIENLDENVRYNFDLQKQVNRSSVEKNVVQNTKQIYFEYKTYNKSTTYVYNPKDYKAEKLEKSINNNLSALYFIEKNNIQSFKQINDMTEMLFEKRTETLTTMSDIKTTLTVVNRKIDIINSYQALQNRLENTDPGYVQVDKQGDLEILAKYEALLSKNNLLDPNTQAEFIQKAAKYNAIYQKLQAESKRINARINDYDKLVSTIKNIDQRISRNAFDSDIKNYEENQKANDENEKENNDESKNKKRGYER